MPLHGVSPGKPKLDGVLPNSGLSLPNSGLIPQGLSWLHRQPLPGDMAVVRGCSFCPGTPPKKSASAARVGYDAGSSPEQGSAPCEPAGHDFWVLIPKHWCPRGRAWRLHLFFFPRWMMAECRKSGSHGCPSPASWSHPRASHLGTSLPILLPKLQAQAAFFAFALFFLFLWELAGAAPCCIGAATGCQLEEAQGTAFGPCYILFQKAIADISTTYTTARDILCYKGFKKHKPPELNTYSMASRFFALESSGTMMQSLAGAEAMQCLTDRGGNRSAKVF